MITESIIASKNSSEWENSVELFLENPAQTFDPEINEIASEHNLSFFLAGILKDSKI
jgi:hypothetical protein